MEQNHKTWSLIPFPWTNPETVIIHTGSSDLKSDNSPEEIARELSI